MEPDQLFAPSGREPDRLSERREAGIRAVGGGDERLKRLTNGANGDRRGIWNLRAIEIWTQIREIPAALGNGWNVLSNRVGVRLSSPFLRKEEEGLSLVGVVVMRNVYRAADGIAEVVLLVGRVGVAWFAAGFPWFRVDEVIAQVFESAAMEGAAAGLGLD